MANTASKSAAKATRQSRTAARTQPPTTSRLRRLPAIPKEAAGGKGEAMGGKNRHAVPLYAFMGHATCSLPPGPSPNHCTPVGVPGQKCKRTLAHNVNELEAVFFSSRRAAWWKSCYT